MSINIQQMENCRIFPRSLVYSVRSLSGLDENCTLPPLQLVCNWGSCWGKEYKSHGKAHSVEGAGCAHSSEHMCQTVLKRWWLCVTLVLMLFGASHPPMPLTRFRHFKASVLKALFGC